MPPIPAPRLGVKPGIAQIDAYVPGQSAHEDNGPVIKLSSNETPLGPSPKAVEAYRQAAATLERYPDGAATALREVLGVVHGIDPDHIVCGNGSDDLLRILAQSYLGAGDEAIHTAYAFAMFRIFILGAGATPVAVPEHNFRADVNAILDAVTPQTRAVFLANPNNPTGTYIPYREVERLRAKLPENVLLVLDAAYAEYVDEADYQPGLQLVKATTNTVMTRTFSKIYGLAGARLGWCACPREVADILHRVRTPFNVPAPNIAVGVAALLDGAYIERARAHNAEWLPWMTQELRALGIEVTDSASNFVLIHFSGQKARTGARANAFLNERRIILRLMDAYGLPNALRLTIGTETENRAVVETLKEFMEGTE